MSAPLLIKSLGSQKLYHLDDKENNLKNVHLYFFEHYNARCGIFLRSHQIESDFDKPIIEPKEIPIAQGTYECGVATYSMLTKIPINEIKKCLYSLGWKNDENGLNHELIKESSLILLDKNTQLVFSEDSSNEPCIITVPSINLKGKYHSLYWNGTEMLDPQFGNKNKKHYSPLWNLDTICRSTTKIKLAKK